MIHKDILNGDVAIFRGPSPKAFLLTHLLDHHNRAIFRIAELRAPWNPRKRTLRLARSAAFSRRARADRAHRDAALSVVPDAAPHNPELLTRTDQRPSERRGTERSLSLPAIASIRLFSIQQCIRYQIAVA